MEPSRFFFSIHGLVLNYKLKSAASSTSKENRLLIISRLFILRFTRCNNPMPGVLEGTAIDDDRSVWTTRSLLACFCCTYSEEIEMSKDAFCA